MSMCLNSFFISSARTPPLDAKIVLWPCVSFPGDFQALRSRAVIPEFGSDLQYCQPFFHGFSLPLRSVCKFPHLTPQLYKKHGRFAVERGLLTIQYIIVKTKNIIEESAMHFLISFFVLLKT